MPLTCQLPTILPASPFDTHFFPVPNGNSTDEYVSRRLARVRVQIDSLSDDLDKAEDPRDQDRIAAAIERLSRIEQQLANRPLPGTRRPAPEPTSRRRDFGLSDLQALPCGVATPTNSVPSQTPVESTPQVTQVPEIKTDTTP